MNNFPLLHGILAFAFSPLCLTAAIAQQTATDAKVLHYVNAVLENEKAFRGLMIVSKVSDGIVTLTGKIVSSEGERHLGCIEVGRADCVNTVLTTWRLPLQQHNVRQYTPRSDARPGQS